MAACGTKKGVEAQQVRPGIAESPSLRGKDAGARLLRRCQCQAAAGPASGAPTPLPHPAFVNSLVAGLSLVDNQKGVQCTCMCPIALSGSWPWRLGKLPGSFNYQRPLHTQP
jgi:hypothetical protein